MVYTGYEIDPNQALKLSVDGKEYDLTKWKNYHPGGHFILHQYNDKDATEVFHAFHGPEAYKKLAHMSGTPVETKPAPLVLAFRKFRDQLKKDGWFEHSLAFQIWKFGSTLAIALAGCALALMGHWIIGAIVLGIGYQQLGWLGHDCCHNNFSKNRRLNLILSYFTGNFMSGFSANWWKNRHNTHHAITNVMDSDPDVDNLPLFVWDVAELYKVDDSALAPAIVSYQEYYFVPWTCLLKLIWKLQSIAFLITPEIQNQSFLNALKWERLTIALHWAWLFILAWQLPSWAAFFGFILISEGVGGAGIALIVFMNHYALDLQQPERRVDANFVELQLIGTRNIASTPFMNWLAGGLNLQIEHHLFPTMPRNNLIRVRPLVQKFCKEQGIEYHELSWWDCLIEVERKLSKVSAAYQQRRAKKVD